jgi:hypothetical protein
MTIYVDRARLRELAGSLPKDAQASAIEAVKNAGLQSPKWDGYDEDPDALFKCATAVVAGAGLAGYKLDVPIDTAPYRARLEALPPDLLDAVEVEARAAGVPHVAHPNKWSVAHAEVVDRATMAAADELRGRLRKLNAAIAGAKFSGQRQGAELDAERHALAAWVSRGRTTSSKELMPFEHDHLVALLERDAVGMVELDIVGTVNEADVVLVDKKTGEVMPAPAVDWKATAKAAGMTQAHLKGRAGELADKLRLPKPPAKTEEWDARLTAAILRSLSVDAAVSTVQAAIPGAAVEGEASAPTSAIPAEPSDGAPNDASAVLAAEPVPAPHLPSTNGHVAIPSVSPAAADAFVLMAIPTSRLGEVLNLLAISVPTTEGAPA